MKSILFKAINYYYIKRMESEDLYCRIYDRIGAASLDAGKDKVAMWCARQSSRHTKMFIICSVKARNYAMKRLALKYTIG